MFGLFKKKKEEIVAGPTELYAVANGTVVAIDQVSDPVFSQKMMGDGYAVLPSDGAIYAPVSGTVLSVFPTQHAVGIALDNGLEILLHMGLDTVQLEGKGFETRVKEGDTLTSDTLVAQVDLAYLTEQGKDTAMIVVVTNMEKVADLSLTKEGTVAAKEVIGTVSAQ